MKKTWILNNNLKYKLWHLTHCWFICLLIFFITWSYLWPNLIFEFTLSPPGLVSQLLHWLNTSFLPFGLHLWSSSSTWHAGALSPGLLPRALYLKVCMHAHWNDLSPSNPALFWIPVSPSLIAVSPTEALSCDLTCVILYSFSYVSFLRAPIHSSN